METFKKLNAIAAPLPMMNIDTDIIIPKQFLKTVKRTGLGVHAFHDIRYHEDGSEKPDFVLNRAPYNKAEILITGENFGCGSSREHAPWAILDFGIKCIIAPGFADIFYNNSFKNGILPIEMKDKKLHTNLLDWVAENKNETISVDLEEQVVTWGNNNYAFDIDPFRKHCLLHGLDDIGLTLEKSAAIGAFEDKREKEKSWL